MQQKRAANNQTSLGVHFLKTDGVIWIREIIEKLASKHHVEPHEVEQVLNSKPKIRFVEKVKERAKMFTCRLVGRKRADTSQCFSSTSSVEKH